MRSTFDEKELHFQALFEQSNDGVFIIGLDLIVKAVNQKAADMLEYTIEELIGLSVDQVMALEQIDTGEQQQNLAIWRGNQPIYERLYRKKGGETIPVEVSTSIVYDKDEVPLHVQSVVRDITMRKQTEAILSRRDNILEAVSFATEQFMRGGIWEAELSNVIKRLGEAAEVGLVVAIRLMKEHQPEHSIISHWVSPKISKTNSVLIKGEKNINYLIHQTQEISPRGIFISSSDQNNGDNLLIAEDKITAIALAPIFVKNLMWGMIGFVDFEHEREWSKSEKDAIRTAANIWGAAIQRENYERDLLQSDIRNKAIVDALPDLVFRIDSFGKVLDVSKGKVVIINEHKQDIVDKNISELWEQTIANLFLDSIEKAIGSGEQQIFETNFSHDNKTFEVRIDRIGINEILAIIRDISDRARLEQMKSDIINRASHELRTPLTTAILMTELIQEGGTEEETEEFWQILRSELNRQKNLIDSFLMAGRLESGMLVVESNLIDLIPVLEEAVGAVKPLARSNQISIKKIIPTSLPPVFGDQIGLQQVFINLINNAVKFSPKESIIEVEVIEGQEMVEVSISDQGLGIPPEDLPQLFERFYRAKNVTVAEIPGSGIGLYLVKSIVDRVGGQVSVNSEMGKGTTFIVQLKVDKGLGDLTLEN